MPRLFIGTLVDADEQKRAEKVLFGCEPGIKFSRPENLHMTWDFIGDCTKEATNEIVTLLAEQIDSIRNDNLAQELNFDLVEFWPNERQPNLIVLTPSSPQPELFECASKIHSLFGAFKTKTENFPFRPHITLARLKNRTVLEEVGINAVKSNMPAPMLLKLTDIGLFSSTSIEHQTVYHAIASHKL